MSENNLDTKLDSATWSEVLVQALPYFKQWVGKVVVVKYGGNAMLNEELKEAVMEDIVLLNTIGVHVVLVHGGGPEINHMLERVGKESKFVKVMPHASCACCSRCDACKDSANKRIWISKFSAC